MDPDHLTATQYPLFAAVADTAVHIAAVQIAAVHNADAQIAMMLQCCRFMGSPANLVY